MSDRQVEQRLVQLAEGVLVERDVLGIIEKVQEYDPNLRVQFLDPTQSGSLNDAPYRIVEIGTDGLPREVFRVWELNDLVLERLRLADTRKVDVLSQLDNVNDAARNDETRRYNDIMGEAKDIVAHIAKSPKQSYKAKDPLTGKTHKFE